LVVIVSATSSLFGRLEKNAMLLVS